MHWSWASYSLSGLSEKILVNINFFREIEKLSNSASSFGTTESQESLLVQKYPPLIFFYNNQVENTQIDIHNAFWTDFRFFSPVVLDL